MVQFWGQQLPGMGAGGFWRQQDTIKSGGMASGNGYAHEFGHLLGFNRTHLSAGDVMGPQLPVGSALTNADKEALLGGFVSAHQFMGTASGQLIGSSKPIIPNLYKPFSSRTNTQAPTWPAGWIYWK
jgi:hypothetical protein